MSLFEDVEFFMRAIWRFGGTFVDHPFLERRVWPSLVRRPGSAEATRQAYTSMHRAFRAAEGMPRYSALKAAGWAVRAWA
jgi:hypothetical protein